MGKFKVGDKVKVDSWNYGWRFSDRGLIQTFTKFESTDLQYTVLAFGMIMDGRGRNVDMLVQSPTGVVYAVMSCFVKQWAHTITIDGATIVLSEESFEELKRQFNG